jgi:hypothetical protein
MRGGGSLLLVVLGLLALFIAITGRYACFENFFVGLFTGNCNAGSGTTATSATSFGSGFLPSGGGRPIFNFPTFEDLFPGLPGLGGGLPGFPTGPFDTGGFNNIQVKPKQTPKNTGVTGGLYG